MRLSEIAAALEAEALVEALEDVEVEYGGGSDSVSDVLVYGKAGMVLLTGLTQPSVVRAAEVIGAAALVFVRGKQPEASLLELAREGRPSGPAVSPFSLRLLRTAVRAGSAGGDRRAGEFGRAGRLGRLGWKEAARAWIS